MKSDFGSSNSFIQTLKRPIFYGWWLVILTLFLNAVTGVPVFGAVGVWIDALESEFGWSRTQLALAFSLGTLEGSIVGPVVGIIVDRIGARRVVLVGVTIIGVGFLILSQTRGLWIFYVAYAVIMLGASGGGWLPMMTVINNWFDRKRSLAMGFGGLGFSMGGFILVPLLAWLAVPDNLGWRFTAMGLGLLFISMAYPISRLIRNIPEEYGEVPDGNRIRKNLMEDNSSPLPTSSSSAEATDRGIDYGVLQLLKIPVFWTLSICNASSSMLIGTMTVHFIISLKDQGIPIQTGAWIWGATMLFSGAAQIFGGWLGDRVPKNVALCVFGLLQAVGVIFATFLTDLYLAPIFIVIFGLGFGARIPLGTAIRGEYFGRRAFGKVLGISMVPTSAAMFAAPIFAGWWFDAQGSYGMAFYILGAISAIGSLGFLLAKKP
jgi:MFS family permease